MEPWNPSELVARIRSGDRTAEAELVARYSRGVTMILRRPATGAQAAADDLYQEVFLRATEKIRAGEVREPGGSRASSAGWRAIWRSTTSGVLRPANRLPIRRPANRFRTGTVGPLERVLRIEDEALGATVDGRTRLCP